MKTLYLFLAFVICLSCKAQQVPEKPGTDLFVNLEPFVGTWQYQNGSEIFRINIWENNLYLKGHVEFIEVTTNNGIEVETVVNTSARCEPNGFCHFPVIFGGSGNGFKMSGLFYDNTIMEGNDYKGKHGYMTLTIQLSQCQGCPVTALWKVNERTGLRPDDEPENFNVPTDIIMTKVE